MKLISFTKCDPFQIVLRYLDTAGLIPGTPTFISRYVIKPEPIKDDVAHPPKIKLKISMDINGIITLKSVQLNEELKETEPEESESNIEKTELEKTAEEKKQSADTPITDSQDKTCPTSDQPITPTDEEMANEKESADSEGLNDSKAKDTAMDTTKNDAGNEEKVKDKPKKRKKKIRRTVIYPSLIQNYRMSDNDFKLAFECEVSMANQDRVVEETAAKRNELESYVYEMRGKLDDEYKEFVKSDIHGEFRNRLNATEEWLYTDEGYATNKSEFVKRITDLRKTGDPIVLRKWESDHRDEVVNILKSVVVRYQMFISAFEAGDEKFNHIKAEDVKTVKDECTSVDRWLSEKLQKQGLLKKFEDVAITIKECQDKQIAIERLCYPIASKTKPPIKEEPKIDKLKDSDKTKEKSDQNSKKPNKESGEKPVDKPSSDKSENLTGVENGMDVD